MSHDAAQSATRVGNVRSVSVAGPIGADAGRLHSASIVDLDSYGYTEQEYFVSGVASAFIPVPGTPLGSDGCWDVVAADDTPFATRILVRRPAVTRFNGTVVVEFMQEYFNSERDTNYRWNAETLLREGFAWVGASLHHEGIDTTDEGEITLGAMTVPAGPSLRQWDEARYGRLSFPHSDLCYDVLSQVGAAVGPTRDTSGADPLAGLPVRRVLAVGNTIAAARLLHYVNAVHPLHRVFDGFFLQDLTDVGVTLSEGVHTPANAWLRVDVASPTIVLNTMTAAVAAVAQPEGELLRFWEPAGSSHTTGPYMVRVAEATKRDFGVDSDICPPEYANTFPVQYISGAALVALNRWAAGGPAAPSFPRLSRSGEPPSVHEDVDEHGNAVGGLRTPWVDVPIARYDWRGECMGGAGRTYPFTAQQLTDIYGAPSNYRQRFADAASEAQKRGVLLADDAREAVAAAGRITW